MSNNEQLFTEIVPNEEASLSGGSRGRRRGGRRQLNANAEAKGVVIGNPRSSNLRTKTKTFVSDRVIFAYALSFVKVRL